MKKQFAALLLTVGGINGSWAADMSGVPAFKVLKTSNSVVLNCTFADEFRTTSEHFSGQLILTSVGEFFLVAQRNSEPPNECQLNLRRINTGERSQGGVLSVIGDRRRACEPRLSRDMRKSLENFIEIRVPRGGLSQEDLDESEISILYLGGLIPCRMLKFDNSEIRKLAKKLSLGSVRTKGDPMIEEPLDGREVRPAKK